MWNNFLQNFVSARIYFYHVFLISAAFLIIFLIFFNHDLAIFLTLLLSVFIFSVILLYFIGSKRRMEITEIRSIIRSIRKSEFDSANEIRLSRSLEGLEDEIKKMFLKTRSDIENLKKLEQVRTEFLGNVSHELRTPIFGIQGYLETLLNGALNDQNVNRNFLQKAANHAEHLNNLLNDLIDISMIESGQMRMSFQFFSIKEFLEPIVNEMRHRAHRKGLELILSEIRPNLQVFGDKTRLRQVMTNLISNAIKYTDSGSVVVGAEEYPKAAHLFVQDTGIGIEESDINRIFERFFRVDRVRSMSIGGTGLGLAIVKHILEAHGTKIEVKSELEKGSKFSFSLKK